MGINIETFQGGGLYDANGQVIHIAVMPSGDIAMIDASRGLEYIFDAPTYPTNNLQRYVMDRYLRDCGRMATHEEDLFFSAMMQQIRGAA